MMDRREFLKAALAGGAAAMTGQLGVLAAQDPATSPLSRDTSREEAFYSSRIASIGAKRVQDRFPRSVGPNARGNPVGGGGAYQVRTITTDDGALGWAMCHAAQEVVEKFVGTRVGDLFSVEEGTVDEARVLDKLFYDLAGSALGRPVWQLLGRGGEREVLLYSGAVYFEDLMPQDQPRGIPGVLAACRQDYEAGYRAFKLKIGRGFKWMPRAEGLARDIEVTRAVTEQFPDCRVLVDANDAFTVTEAVNYVEAVADCQVYWIEEPFEENREDLLTLHEAMDKVGCKALIADGERRKSQASPPTAFGGYTQEFVDRLFALADEKLVDVFLMDLDIVGFSRWRKAMPLLVEAGVQASPHTWMWTPRPCYTAQLAAGVGNVPIVEGIPGRAKGIDYSAYRLQEGKLVMPQEPGFGLKLVN